MLKSVLLLKATSLIAGVLDCLFLNACQASPKIAFTHYRHSRPIGYIIPGTSVFLI